METARILGMDTDEARNQSGRMQGHAEAVNGAMSQVAAKLGPLQWTGRDAQSFVDSFNGTFAPQAKGATTSMEDNAGVLRSYADRQDEASA